MEMTPGSRAAAPCRGGSPPCEGEGVVRRILVVGVLAIFSFGSVNLAAVSWLTGRRALATPIRVADGMPMPVYVAPPAATPPAPAPAAALAPVATPAPAPDPAAAAEASAAAARALEDRVTAAAIKRPPHRLGRGSVAPVDLFAGLRALESLVSTCAGDGGLQSASSDARDEVVLLLDIETLEGKVRIVDAPVQARGSVSEAIIRCAQGELRGQEIAVELSRPGSRLHLPLTLHI